LLCMSAALLLALKGHQLGSAIGLALGGLVKFFPALLLPVWGRRWSKTAWLAFAMVFALPWLPLLAGGTPFNGLGTFARRVDFNSSLYRLIESAWNLLLNSPYARLWSLATVFVVLILIYVGFLAFRHSDRDILSGWRFMGTLFGLGLLLSPVVHPWYVCWLLAFIAIDGQPAWLVLSVTVIFARHVYIGYEQSGVWQEAWWPSLAVWIPFYLAIAVSMWSSQKSSRKFAARHPSTGT
jgi:Glycosyltransferase family 87